MIQKLSIITINYNNKQGLINTIESVINQTYSDFEFIVIDGGSDDGSFEVLQHYNDKIDYWVSEPDNGIYHAMNKGVNVAKGKYCNFMNSGDCFFNNTTLENVFKLNLTEDIYIGKAKTDQRIISPPDNPTFNYFYYKRPINHQAAFINHRLLLKYPYDELNYKIVSDYNFFFEALILENCTYRSLDEFVVIFDATGIGSLNIDFNIEEQNKMINLHICPRIIEDFADNIMKYKDFKIVRFSVFISILLDKYARFFNPTRYIRKLKRIRKNY